MKKTFTFLGVLFLIVVLAACGKKEPKPEFDVIINGIQDVELEVGDPFNVLEGVTAVGTDKVDYTDKIEVKSVATITNNMLDTSAVATVALKYVVELTEKEFITEKLRTVTIKAPPKPVGDLIANGTFDTDYTYWDTFSADGSTIELSIDGGALKAEVTAGANAWTPRVTQMGVEFEKDKAYKISFKAKASAEKMINLQVGEILASAPWFTDFKPGQVVHKTLTTDWQTYDFTFMHTLDNKLGGVLFEFGNVDTLSNGVAVTIWLDDIVAEETTLGADEEAPVITVSNASVLVGGTVDLSTLVSVMDLRDGTIPFANLVIEIKNGAGEVVSAIDTSVPDVFTVTVTAEDEAGNSETATFTVTVTGMLFYDTNIIVNGDFAQAFGDPAEWGYWLADWEGAAATVAINDTDKTVEIDVTQSGSAGWHVQFFQNDVPLVEGKTYKLSFDIKATVARTFNLEVADGANAENPTKYLDKPNLNVTTEFVTHEFIFTVTSDCQMGKLNFMFGTGDAAKFTLDNISIVEAKLDTTLRNPNFDMIGYVGFVNDWEGSAGHIEIVDGELKLVMTQLQNLNEADTWKLQIWQNGPALGLGEENYLDIKPNTSYILKFDAYASKAEVITKALISAEVIGWVNMIATADQTITVTDTKQTFQFTFTTPAEITSKLQFKLEFGTGFTNFVAAEGVSEFFALDNVTLKEDVENAPELIFNNKMDDALYYVFDHSGAGVESGTLVQTENGALITTTLVGDQPYMPHFYQMMNGLQAGSYKMKFVINSSVARTLRLNIVVPDWGYQSLLPDTFIDIVVTEALVNTDIVVEVSFDVVNQITSQVKLELDLGKVVEGDLPGEFLVKQILIYQVFE